MQKNVYRITFELDPFARAALKAGAVLTGEAMLHGAKATITVESVDSPEYPGPLTAPVAAVSPVRLSGTPLKAASQCPDCSGTGRRPVSGGGRKLCSTCRGEGEI